MSELFLCIFNGNIAQSLCLPFSASGVHKSQGSEFPAVVIPLATQHYMLLQRNLIYTGITRGKRLLVLIGQKKALGIAVRNDRPQRRYSGLLGSLRVPPLCPARFLSCDNPFAGGRGHCASFAGTD
ncbi:MAG TPA: ATP-binding domain-containing protein [Terriglobales bacterium]|nr:ATP-binding domain-containing protein [Terriglobales bacterium]